ncbi:ribonuclease J [Pseudovibrio exalbescens]|uniref:MBL fold metallo-hydrolase n=1 Tax=Pseudovibrio exalbescens TaxID=197461 RepID=A0A1U7JFY1_9HYPH|nr:ribonuclease J [Pseudovibrio exalbescens]OKL43551.1 MBL fold metallo-hydrolase [Pseudovibrio exalbescens]
MSSQNQLVFLPLGGVGEIGMNLGLYGVGPENDRKWLIVDFGISFAGPELPGVDLILPDIRFLEEERSRIAGIVITHAHEDHYGALPYIWEMVQAPVYATPFAAGLLEAKYGVDGEQVDIPVTLVNQGDRLKIGPFDVEFLTMTHSIPEPCGLALRADGHLVVHSGDWKIDPTPGVGKVMDMDRLRALGEEGVDALICDSTNAVRDGISPSEADVQAELTGIIKKAKGRVAVTTFASNVARIRAIAEAARAADREVVVVGRSMLRVIEVAKELGYLDGLPAFRDEETYGHFPRDKVVMICTGSQGENRAAMARIAADNHRQIGLSAGDTVIFSSRTIPGNEKAVNTVINSLVSQGVHVVTDRDALVHVSGHPRRGELDQLYSLLKPSRVVPVHGEPLHLACHKDFALSKGVTDVKIIKDGDMVRLAPGPLEVIDEAPVGIMVRDGDLIMMPEEAGVQERRKLSFAGTVVVSLAVTSKGEMHGDIDVVLFGIPEFNRAGEPFEDLVHEAVYSAVISIPKSRRKDVDVVTEAARRSARYAVVEHWGKKPLCRALVRKV